MADKVIIKRFRYVLDWFEIDDVEVDLEKFSSFEMQLRGRDWYLLHHVHENGKFRRAFEYDFCLDKPRQAVRCLGERLRKFSSVHAGGETFVSALRDLLREDAKPAVAT